MRRPGQGRRQGSGREFLLEFHQIGNSVKVSAIDPVTGTEVSIVGPATATRLQLSRMAARKLTYVLNGRRPVRGPKKGGRGVIV